MYNDGRYRGVPSSLLKLVAARSFDDARDPANLGCQTLSREEMKQLGRDKTMRFVEKLVRIWVLSSMHRCSDLTVSYAQRSELRKAQGLDGAD